MIRAAAIEKELEQVIEPSENIIFLDLCTQETFRDKIFLFASLKRKKECFH